MSRTTTSRQMVTAKNYDDLCVRAVEKIIDVSAKAVNDRRLCRIALSGGETPKGVYSLLASLRYRNQLDWSRIHSFLVDERWVPQESPRSNYGMMLACGLPAATLHPIKTNISDAAESALLYQQELAKEFQLEKGRFPEFDLILLGMGEDGHTASLFPNHPVLKVKENLVAVVENDGVPESRITLTLPVLNHARSILFLVSGHKKAATLKDIFEGRGKTLPAAQVHAQNETCWLVDQTATS